MADLLTLPCMLTRVRAAQQETLVNVTAAQQETNRLQNEQLQEAMLERVAMFQHLEQLATIRAPATTSVRSTHELNKMAIGDDTEADLLAFEKTTTWERWSHEKWAGIIAQFLAGDQKAYFDLATAAADNYDVLKAEILARAGIITTLIAQKYHSWIFKMSLPPRSRLFDLIH